MPKKLLAILLLVAFVLRVVGIGYGLPLWLVGDEPAFIFGSFKMMELHTLIPAFHQADFISTFYYPPYLSYLYLLPFIAVACVKYLFFSGTFGEFTQFLQTDLSVFFLVSRLISAMIGTATVYVVYRVGKNMFHREGTALLAAAFLAFSFLHVNFSHWGRHWVPATGMFSLILFCLSHPEWSARKRYLTASLIVGVGMGVTQQVGLLTLCIVIWFFLVDRFGLRTLREWWPWACVGMYLFLSLIAYSLWPPGFYVAAAAGEFIAKTPKTLSGFLSGYEFYFMNLVRSEPLLLLWLIIRCVVGIKHRDRFLLASAVFGFLYIAAFYFLFLHTDRFLLLLYPLFALVAARGISVVGEKKFFTVATMVFMMIPVIRYDLLLVKNDTRIQMLQIAKKEIPAGAKVMVMAPLTRLPATVQSIEEQEVVDAASIRSVDNAERFSSVVLAPPRYHALNLFSVRNVDFLANIGEYRQSHGYEYVIYEPLLAEERVGDIFARGGTTIAQLHGYVESRGDSVVNGIGDGWKQLFFSSSIGPEMVMKKFSIY